MTVCRIIYIRGADALTAKRCGNGDKGSNVKLRCNGKADGPAEAAAEKSDAASCFRPGLHGLNRPNQIPASSGKSGGNGEITITPSAPSVIKAEKSHAVFYALLGQSDLLGGIPGAE